MAETSKKLKERFCKDCNIPIRVFVEPYFSKRIELYDKYYGTVEKWNLFIGELEKYGSEKEYFEEYNRVKDEAILSIKESEGYKEFNDLDMNQFRVKNLDLPKGDIFKPSNDGRKFLSIDMKKANFSALNYYDSSIFDFAKTWEEFISRFTDNEHIIKSKYIRQVIMGNCNPKRHITYEKCLMDRVIELVLSGTSLKERVVFFSNDEIVFDVTEDCVDLEYVKIIRHMLDGCFNYPLKVELFKLRKINGTSGYLKEIYTEDGSKVEFKCLDSYSLPFVIRYMLGEEVTEDDKVFIHEGLLSKFIETPNIEVVWDD